MQQKQFGVREAPLQRINLLIRGSAGWINPPPYAQQRETGNVDESETHNLV